MKKKAVLSMLVFVALVGAGTAYRVVRASDHDDGENDLKSRALNLTDHYVWKDTSDATKLNFIQTSNPRSLGGFQYFFSSNARYEINITRVKTNGAAPSGVPDVTYRFEFAANDLNNHQAVTFTVLNGGTVVGSTTATTANFADSSAVAAGASTSSTIQTLTVNGVAYKFWAGLREDTFNFDVQRFFEVRNFLYNAFFGGVAATTPLAAFQTKNTCDGNYFLKGFGAYDTLSGSLANSNNGDPVHLFNPPSCAPDFTYHYNRNEIELQAPISSLQANSETIFDTWSTISIPQ